VGTAVLGAVVGPVVAVLPVQATLFRVKLVGTGFEGLGIPFSLAVALWLLAAGSVWTVGQRIVAVHRSARAVDAPRPAT